MLETLVTNTILGGITGYITNNLAIKMLFKEYMGFGGVIEKEYQSFIDNISSLIEKDLINHNTLSPEIHSEQFQNALKEIISTIILLELPRNGEDKQINELNGFEESQKNIFNYLDSAVPTLQNNLVDILKKESYKNVVSQNQYDFMTSKFSKIIYDRKNQINDIFYENISNKSLDELITNKTLYQLKLNLQKFIDEIDFREFDGDINKFFYQLLEVIEIDEIIENLQKDVGNMYISDFINDSDNLSRELVKRVIEVINSEDGEKILEKLLKEIITTLKNIDDKIYDILDKQTIEKLNFFIENKLPDILNDVLFFVDRNRKEIEHRIDSTIDKVLDRSISGKILKNIKNIFMDDLVSKYGVVEKIKEVIEEYGDKAPKEISNQLLEMLQTKTIGEIITLLEENGVLNVNKIIKLIQKNIVSLKTQKIDFIDEFLTKKVSDLIDVDFSFLKQDVIWVVFDMVKEKFIYTEKFKRVIKKEISTSFDNIKTQKIENFITKFDFDIDVDLSKYYEKLDKKIDIDFEIPIDYKESLSKLSNKKLNSLYTPLQTPQNIEKIKDMTIQGLETNLKTLLSGNVSLAVSKELSKFEPSQIRDMVEGFMGKELKPINTLGTILGSIAGAGYYAATIPFANPYLSYATPLIYGVTGVFTNHLAINMLFRPYEKKKYLPYFSPGVVAKQKPKFAENISSFVKNDILTDEALKGLFDKNKTSWQEYLKEFISKDDYFILEKLLKDNIEKISTFSYVLLVDFVTENSDKISKKIVEHFEENIYLLDEKIPQISALLLDMIYELDFSEFVVEKLNNYQLSQFVPIILSFISQNDDLLVEKISQNLEFNQVKKSILNFEQNYNEFIQNNNLDKYLNKYKNNISSKISQKLIETIENKELINMFVEKIETENFSPNQRLSELFDGGLKRFFDDNIDYLIDEMVENAKANRYEIEDKIIDSLPFGTKWMLEDKVKEIVEEIFDDTLPNFINSKQLEIKNIFSKILDYRLADIGLENSLDKNKLTDILLTIYKSDSFNKSVENLVKITLNSILEMKLETALKLLNIRNLRQLVDILEPVLRDVLDDIDKKLQNNQIIEITNNLLEVVLNDITNNKTFLYLLENIDINEELNLVFKKIKSDEKLKKEIFELLSDMIEEFVNSDFYNKDILKDDLEKFIKSFIQKDELKNILIPFIKEIFMNLNQNLDVKLKDDLRDKFIKATFDSLEINLNLLVESVDIQKVIQREINEMHPKEIEEMFYSFAGDYFKKLKLYGAFGAVFGVPSVFV